jgi:hypothetical protein
MQLLEQGRSIEQIATTMRLTVARAQRYIEEEELARDLSHHHCDEIPAARIRELYDQRREEDPTLSIARIARTAKLDDGTVSAALGPTTIPHGAENADLERDDRVLVGVEPAARIVQALGFAPHEVHGL